MRKKVTYIVSEIDKAVFFEHTAIQLRNKGFDLSFILLNCDGGEFHKFLASNNFVVYSLRLKRIVYSPIQVLNCIKLLLKIKPDIIHTHMPSANWIGLWSAWFCRIPKRIFTRHSGWPLIKNRKEEIIDYIQNKLATSIVAPSENVVKLLVSQGVKKSKIMKIHHGFDLARMAKVNAMELERIRKQYNGDNKFPIIGVVARWLELKGIQYVIPAFKQFLIDYPNAKLCLFNANTNLEFSSTISNLLNELPRESYELIVFEKNVYDLYYFFNIYIHVPVNEKCEAFGQTYIESLVAGIPSIFTVSGVAKEFIENEKNAIVVDYESSKAIYLAMKKIMESNEIRDKIVVGGKESVTKLFSLETYMSNLIRLYS